MSDKKNIFVVVDPSNETHVALERVLIIQQFMDVKPRIRVFVAVDTDAVDTRETNDNLFRNQDWFAEQIRGPLEEAGLEYDIQLCWSTKWQESILQESRRFSADEIYLPVQRHAVNSRFSFTQSKWDVIKGSYCPVILVRPGGIEQRKVILAAVNFQATSEVQQNINTMILERGQEVASNYAAEFHIVNAFRDSINYPDRGKLSNASGLPASNIHVEEGFTSDVVARVSEKLGADLVIMGTLGQNGKTGSLTRGNTAERVIAALRTDVMVYNAS